MIICRPPDALTSVVAKSGSAANSGVTAHRANEFVRAMSGRSAAIAENRPRTLATSRISSYQSAPSVADRRARGWARAGTGRCDFCAMLIGRGAVYTEATANFETHDHCGCVAVPES